MWPAATIKNAIKPMRFLRFMTITYLSGARLFCRAKVEWCCVALLFPFSGGLRAAGLPPQEALNHMKVADGFEVKLVASEPEIRQPLSVTFDERGRMWVVQYLQYPTPAGLKPVSVDQYLRTKYDRVPDPPPRGPKGADRITICEDTDRSEERRVGKECRSRWSPYH